MDKNRIQAIVLSILDKDGSRVKKSIKKILETGKPCIPFLLKLVREHYENDFDRMAPAYIPYNPPEMVSYVDNGNFFTAAALALYLVESIRQNREIHGRSLSDLSLNIKLAARRHHLKEQLIERLIYEMIMEVALRTYERWWEMVENKDISFPGDDPVWTWYPETCDPIILHIFPQAKEFACLDPERLRIELPHHEITTEEWETYNDRQKCCALGLKSSIYLQ